ncbi:replication-relaxation family protein [Candidatus Curtissbacteria bacterium]|nr:replication-relaxation family protein [Candidatus Curtissbacteria bacterium]
MNYRELPEIGDKQKEIVNLVFKFRFINRVQMQKLFGHKDPSRINKWLKDLVEKKYLGRIYSHKLLENTKPAIYYLNNNGIIWVRYEKGMEYGADNERLEFKYLKKFYEDKHASESFIKHCTTIFDFYIQFKEVEKKYKKKNLEYLFETKTESWMLKQLYQDGDGDFLKIRDIIPDAHIERVIETKDSFDERSFFLILFDPHVPRYAIRYKVDEYIKFHEDENWSHVGLSSEFPTLLLIFPTQQKANQIGKYIKKQLENQFIENMTFMVTSYEKAINEGIGNNGIWERVKTA